MINCLLNLYRFPPSCTIQVRHNRSQFLSSLSFAFHESARRILSIEKKARRFHSIRRRDFMTFFVCSSRLLIVFTVSQDTKQYKGTQQFLLYFLIKRSTLSARLWVHEKVLQTSFQLLHVSEETRVFARRMGRGEIGNFLERSRHTPHRGIGEREHWHWLGFQLFLFFCISLFSFFSPAFLLPLHQRLSSFWFLKNCVRWNCS